MYKPGRASEYAAIGSEHAQFLHQLRLGKIQTTAHPLSLQRHQFKPAPFQRAPPAMHH